MDLDEMSREQYLNGRAIEDRIEELESELIDVDRSEVVGSDVFTEEAAVLDIAELRVLRDVVEEIEAYCSDKLRDTTLIAEEVWADYAKELAEDIGAVSSEAGWPVNLIDWEEAGKQLAQDYEEVVIGGFTFLYR